MIFFFLHYNSIIFLLAVVINGQIGNTATVSTCAVPPTIIALDPSRCKKDATEAAIGAGEATIYYEKAYDSTDAGGTELDLIQKSDMPYEIIIGPNSDSPMSVRIDQFGQTIYFCFAMKKMDFFTFELECQDKLIVEKENEQIEMFSHQPLKDVV